MIRNVHTSTRFAFLSAGVIALLSALPCAAQTIRSTHYNGTGYARLPYAARFDVQGLLTIESWVNFEPATAGSTFTRWTIASKGRTKAMIMPGAYFGSDPTKSYWFGATPVTGGYQLFFSRDGVSFATGTQVVPGRQWRHVAVTVNGTSASFYVDGQAAGTATVTMLTGSYLTDAGDLLIGKREKYESYLSGQTPAYRVIPDSVAGFAGYLDETRIWSIVRTPAQVQSGMYTELRSGTTGLVAAFGSGGLREDVAGVNTVLSGGTADVLGILPRDLVVPKANGAFVFNVDGVISEAEYGIIGQSPDHPGCEKVVIPYRGLNGVTDAYAYLVHDDNYLYIGVRNVRGPTGTWSANDSYLSVLIDSTGGRRSLAQSTDVQIRTNVNPNDAAFQWLVGSNSVFGFTLATLPAVAGVQVSKRIHSGDVGPIDVELRISRAFLGTWGQTDGIALGHLAISTVNDDRMSPGDARLNAPSTWARMTYSDAVQYWPRADIRGHVYDTDSSSSRPAPNQTVYLRDASTDATFATTQTDAAGAFVFRDADGGYVRIPPAMLPKVQLFACSDCSELGAPVVGTTGVRPTNVYALGYAVFPACGDVTTTTHFSSLDFHLRVPPPPVTLTSFTPAEGVGQYELTSPFRAGDTAHGIPPGRVDGDIVTINGTNLHDRIAVRIGRWADRALTPPPAWGYPQIVDRDAVGRSWVRVRIPRWSSTSATDRAQCCFIVEDTWARTGRVQWVTPATPFIYREASYPQVWGFGFQNQSHRATLSEFEGVYGDSLWLSTTFCLPDPVAFAWYLAFRELSGPGGTCVGMASTSLMLKHGSLPGFEYRSPFDPGVLCPAAQPGLPPCDASGFICPDRTARYFDIDCGPNAPQNLWAAVCVNHGAQFSCEFVTYVLQQGLLQGGLLQGDPVARLAEVRAHPFDRVLCCVRTVGEGHGVTPYEVEDVDSNTSLIHIYDNNFPLDDTQSIRITRNTNRFALDSLGWSGKRIYSIPLSAFSGSHHLPWTLASRIGTGSGFSSCLLGMAFGVVAGDADAMYEAPDGRYWGWTADGTLHEQWPGLTDVTPFNNGTPTRNVPVVFPLTDGAPRIRVNPRGGNYLVSMGADGNLVQLKGLGAAPGETPVFDLRYTGQALSGFRCAPNSGTAHIVPQLAISPSASQRALFIVSRLDVPAGRSVEVNSLPAARGLTIRNNTGQPLTYRLTAATADSTAGVGRTALFGPFTLAENATQRLTIADWPNDTTLRSEIDAGSDGSYESSALVAGAVRNDIPEELFTDDDTNADGVPDVLQHARGDMNCDGRFDDFDIDPFVLALVDRPTYALVHAGCDADQVGDINGDGRMDYFDLDPFVNCLTQGHCP